jgi:hypothetical protein
MLSELFTEECHRARVIFSLEKENRNEPLPTRGRVRSPAPPVSSLVPAAGTPAHRRVGPLLPPRLIPAVPDRSLPGFASPTSEPRPPAHLLPGRPPPRPTSSVAEVSYPVPTDLRPVA